MAAPDFPASPTVGQTYTAPSGLVYKWDGAVWSTQTSQAAYWSDTGTALTPATATRGVSIPAQQSLLLGNRPSAKARISGTNASDGASYASFTVNKDIYGGIDDAAQNAWMLMLSAGTIATYDELRVQHYDVTTGASRVPLRIDGPSGRVDIPGVWSGSSNDWSQLTLGTTGVTAARGRICQEQGGRLDLLCNGKLASAWASDDTARPSWLLGLDSAPAGDMLGVWRAPATTGAPAWVNFLKIDNAGVVSVPRDGIFFKGSAGLYLTLEAAGTYATLNFNHPWSPVNTGIGGWQFKLEQDNVQIWRKKAGDPGGTVSSCFGIDNTGVLSVQGIGGGASRISINGGAPCSLWFGSGNWFTCYADSSTSWRFWNATNGDMIGFVVGSANTAAIQFRQETIDNAAHSVRLVVFNPGTTVIDNTMEYIALYTDSGSTNCYLPYVAGGSCTVGRVITIVRYGGSSNLSYVYCQGSDSISSGGTSVQLTSHMQKIVCWATNWYYNWSRLL